MFYRLTEALSHRILLGAGPKYYASFPSVFPIWGFLWNYANADFPTDSKENSFPKDPSKIPDLEI